MADQYSIPPPPPTYVAETRNKTWMEKSSVGGHWKIFDTLGWQHNLLVDRKAHKGLAISPDAKCQLSHFPAVFELNSADQTLHLFYDSWDTHKLFQLGTPNVDADDSGSFLELQVQSVEALSGEDFQVCLAPRMVIPKAQHPCFLRLKNTMCFKF